MALSSCGRSPLGRSGLRRLALAGAARQRRPGRVKATPGVVRFRLVSSATSSPCGSSDLSVSPEEIASSGARYWKKHSCCTPSFIGMSLVVDMFYELVRSHVRVVLPSLLHFRVSCSYRLSALYF